jgi:2'-5' RNA ligase
MTGNAFLAVDLSTDERHALSRALDEASPGPRVPGKRARPENWHITLRFLGPVDEVVTDRVLHEVSETLDARAGRVVCTGLGAFPRPAKATVLYVGIDDPAELLPSIAAQCEAACRDVGLEPQERPFVGHLTLSRIRPPTDVTRLIGSYGEFAVPVRVASVSLMRTMPDERGVRYTEIGSIPLG